MTNTKKAVNDVIASEAQIHLEMDLSSYNLINCLVATLEASSVGEVIRRAIQAYEVYEPEFVDGGNFSSVDEQYREAKKKNLHVRIPMRTKERLDKAKAEINGTYSDVISRSLSIFAQIIRDRQELLNSEVENGNDDPKTSAEFDSPDRISRAKPSRKVEYSI